MDENFFKVERKKDIERKYFRRKDNTINKSYNEAKGKIDENFNSTVNEIKTRLALDNKNQIIAQPHKLYFDINKISDFYKFTGEEFEYLIADLLKLVGYKDVKVVSMLGTNANYKGDGGVDIIAFDQHRKKVAVQCKNTKQVSNDVITRTHGAKDLYKYRCDYGMVITSGTFTVPSMREATDLGVILWSGEKVLQMIKEVNEEVSIKGSLDSLKNKINCNSDGDVSDSDENKSSNEEVNSSSSGWFPLKEIETASSQNTSNLYKEINTILNKYNYSRSDFHEVDITKWKSILRTFNNHFTDRTHNNINIPIQWEDLKAGYDMQSTNLEYTLDVCEEKELYLIVQETVNNNLSMFRGKDEAIRKVVDNYTKIHSQCYIFPSNFNWLFTENRIENMHIFAVNGSFWQVIVKRGLISSNKNSIEKLGLRNKALITDKDDFTSVGLEPAGIYFNTVTEISDADMPF